MYAKKVMSQYDILEERYISTVFFYGEAFSNMYSN